RHSLPSGRSQEWRARRLPLGRSAQARASRTRGTVMNAAAKTVTSIAPSQSVSERVEKLDWERVWQELDAQGGVMIGRLLSPDESKSLAALYPKDDIFRSRDVMARHGFGRGEYKYFRYPLPDLIAGLRTAIYPTLSRSPIAGTRRWVLMFATRRSTRISLSAAVRPARTGRRRFCSSMGPTITTACIRTSMASMSSRSSSRFY